MSLGRECGKKYEEEGAGHDSGQSLCDICSRPFRAEVHFFEITNHFVVFDYNRNSQHRAHPTDKTQQTHGKVLNTEHP
jgi:hypothetical protein